MDKKRDVTIKAYRKPDGAIGFKMFEDKVETESLIFDKTKDKMKKSDSYDIEFTLVNEQGVALEFVTHQTKPGQPVMYLAKGSSTHIPPCPMGPTTTPLPDFEIGTPKATSLTVKNKDRDVCFYKFVLRFVDTSTNQIVEYDPIYDNRNGGGEGFDSSFAATGVASFFGAASGAAVAGWGSQALTPASLIASTVIGGLIGMAVAMLFARLRRG